VEREFDCVRIEIAMPSLEHLAILRQGVEVWNKWRSDGEATHPDLSEIALRSTDLKSDA
jgi:hypothetical protein